jgi:hypothetical protein
MESLCKEPGGSLYGEQTMSLLLMQSAEQCSQCTTLCVYNKGRNIYVCTGCVHSPCPSACCLPGGAVREAVLTSLRALSFVHFDFLNQK